MRLRVRLWQPDGRAGKGRAGEDQPEAGAGARGGVGWRHQDYLALPRLCPRGNLALRHVAGGADAVDKQRQQAQAPVLVACSQLLHCGVVVFRRVQPQRPAAQARRVSAAERGHQRLEPFLQRGAEGGGDGGGARGEVVQGGIVERQQQQPVVPSCAALRQQRADLCPLRPHRPQRARRLAVDGEGHQAAVLYRGPGGGGALEDDQPATVLLNPCSECGQHQAQPKPASADVDVHNLRGRLHRRVARLGLRQPRQLPQVRCLPGHGQHPYRRNRQAGTDFAARALCSACAVGLVVHPPDHQRAEVRLDAVVLRPPVHPAARRALPPHCRRERRRLRL
mmetsp:Transcript_40004/g.129503  ORF Transcript_40004/g.129503 Transcript_40004/m.129503 type:complete len:337 (-) Transcript_40004:159-1169(-)